MTKMKLKINFGPIYSPWSNGINERNHYSADQVVKKKVSFQNIVNMAAWTHNTNVNVLGYAPMQLVTGKSVTIPGLTTGNEATEALFDGEKVQAIIEGHVKMIDEFRKQECGRIVSIAQTARC